MGRRARERAARRARHAAQAAADRADAAVRGELAAQLDAAGVSAEAARVDGYLRNPFFGLALNVALRRAKLGPRHGENDIREIALRVLREQFACEPRGVILKVFVEGKPDARERRLSLRAVPGAAEAIAAAGVAREKHADLIETAARLATAAGAPT